MMTYENAVAFRHGLETRLKAVAASRSIAVNRLRKMVALERYLARLLAVAPDRWLLKGGMALEFRFQGLARATKDLDLWMRERSETAIDALISATEVDLQDYFVYTVEQTGRIETDDVGAALRFRLRADLAGREFETVAIDIALGGAMQGDADLLTGSNLLAFAGMEPVSVPALSLDRHVAEKLHAYTRTYAADSSSSRVKDLVDLVLISSLAEFSATRLRQTIGEDFRRSENASTSCGVSCTTGRLGANLRTPRGGCRHRSLPASWSSSGRQIP